MRKHCSWWLLMLIVVLGAAAMSPPAAAGDRVVISFADLGGIRDWRPGPDGTLLVQSLHRKWYRATFFGSCPEVRFTDTIAFVTEPDGSLDKFSSILVDGRRCWFRTFSEVTDPAELEKLAPKPKAMAPEVE